MKRYELSWDGGVVKIKRIYVLKSYGCVKEEEGNGIVMK